MTNAIEQVITVSDWAEFVEAPIAIISEDKEKLMIHAFL